MARIARLTNDRDTRSLNLERRRHRRHDLEQQEITLDRYDPARRMAMPIGRVVDLSAGGVRVRTDSEAFRPDTQIRVRLRLPVYAGISPFIASGDEPAPSNEWVGWFNVRRVRRTDGEIEVAGELLDMEEMDRGMLGLYLSTQPLAA
jgi:hypothetical protein